MNSPKPVINPEQIYQIPSYKGWEAFDWRLTERYAWALQSEPRMLAVYCYAARLIRLG